MSLEQKINYQLNKIPGVKKFVKRSYQLAMYAISPKIKSEGNIIRISPNDGKEYFFGYYDKSPWDSTGRYMLCLRANNTWSDVSPKETADILLIDTQNDNAIKKIAETKAWNVQQACMLQWLGPDYSTKILFNDFRDGKYVTVIKELATGNEKIISAASYTVSADGTKALTLDFSRLYSLRPGYGYYNIPEETKGVSLPDTTAIWVINLENGEIKPLLKYTDFASFQPRQEMKEAGSVHKVNHLMLSPDGKRFMVLYRWFNGTRKYTRLITCNVDGTDMYVLNDDDMTSHCCWKDNEHILAFENKKDGGPGYYLMKDRSQEFLHLWKQYSNDGHPSYSPDGKLIATDSYPDRARIADIKILRENESSGKIIARVFAPFKYDNDTRCDLHPRWSRDSKSICFDSVFEGHRGLYTVKLEEQKATDVCQYGDLVSCVIPTYRRCDTLPRAIDSILAQTYENFEILIVDDNEPGSRESNDVKEVVNNYANTKKVFYVGQEKHINGAAARNAGIKAARGSLIGFLDDDDEWCPTKLEQQVKYLVGHPEIDGVTCLYIILEDGKEVGKCKPYETDNLQLKVLLRQVAMFMPTFVGKKSIIDLAGAFDPDLKRHQDLQFYTDFLNYGTINLVPESMVIVHSDSVINRPDVEKLIDIKDAYFQSIKNTLEKYDKKTQKRIYNAHYFEIVVLAARQKKIATIMKYLCKIGINPKAYADVIKRFKDRH